MEVRPLDLRDAGEIERDITAFARDSDGGLIVTCSPAATVHRNLIYALALRHRLPVVYNSRFYVSSGGLISYRPHFRRSIRVCRGVGRSDTQGPEPCDPAGTGTGQVRTCGQSEIAKALGMVISPAVLSRAGDVIK